MNSGALTYLLRTKIRNYFRDLFKKPGRLILLIIIVLALGVSIVGGIFSSDDAERKVKDISLLCAIINALFILIFTTSFLAGIKSGGSFFKMQDVNLIFIAPFSKQKVLFYGLIQQMGTNIFIGFFLLFQYTILRSNFDINIWGLLLLFFSYTVVSFLGQCCGLFLYTFISDSDSKKFRAKAIYTLLIIALVVYVGINVWARRDSLVDALALFGDSIFVHVFPFAGWMGAFTSALFHGKLLTALLWLALSVASFFVFLAIVAKSDRDYYEDVISSAEAMQSAIASAKENTLPENAPKNVKVGVVGIGKGFGASVLFWKHMKEDKRSAKFIVSPTSLIYVVMSIVFALFLRGAFEGTAMLSALVFSSYMLVFSLALGRFNRELCRPYIYLIPESPVKKMFYATLETLPTAIVESVLIFVPCAVLLKAGALECILCIICRVTFALLFTGGNIIIERLWSGSLSKVIGFLVYLLVNILLALPGVAAIIACNALGIVIVNTTVTALVCMTIINLPVTLLAFYLSRNMLQYSESAA